MSKVIIITPQGRTSTDTSKLSISTPVKEAGVTEPDSDGKVWQLWEHTGEIKLSIDGLYWGSYQSLQTRKWNDILVIRFVGKYIKE